MRYILLLLLTMSSIVFADKVPLKYNEVQLENIQYACEFGKTTIIKHEEDMCFIFAAITWRETRSGFNTGHHRPNQQDIGLFQINMKTATRRLAQQGTVLPREELRELLADRDVSAYFAEFELSEWLKYHKGDIWKSLNSYNAGFNYKKAGDYADHVLRIAKYLKDNREKFNI